MRPAGDVARMGDTNGRPEMLIQGFGGKKLRERDHLQDPV